MSIGIGTDVHRLVPGVPMHLAGLAWPDEPAGLEGHSDADVAAHAACDALFSAAGLGDLGTNFGTSEPAWAGASGVALLTETARRVRDAGVFSEVYPYDVGDEFVRNYGAAGIILSGSPNSTLEGDAPADRHRLQHLVGAEGRVAEQAGGIHE